MFETPMKVIVKEITIEENVKICRIKIPNSFTFKAILCSSSDKLDVQKDDILYIKKASCAMGYGDITIIVWDAEILNETNEVLAS